jgi:hypothetical protein
MAVGIQSEPLDSLFPGILWASPAYCFRMGGNIPLLWWRHPFEFMGHCGADAAWLKKDRREGFFLSDEKSLSLPPL